MIRLELGEFAAGPFRVGDATKSGISASRLRGSDLARPFWGVRTSAPATEIAQLATAYLTRMPDTTFYSHSTAAQVWQIPLPLRLQSALPLHVSTPPSFHPPQAAGIVGHRLDVAPEDIVEYRGFRVTSLERTLCDLAAALDDEGFVAAGDNILWRRRPAHARATATSLAEAFGRFGGRRGRPRLRELVPFLSDRSDAPPESVFRFRFWRAGFPLCLPNYNIDDAAGNFVATPDLQFADYRMAFDYEGDHHRTDKKQWRKDLRRVPHIQDAGWHHTRLSGDDLANSAELMARVKRLLRERGWR